MWISAPPERTATRRGAITTMTTANAATTCPGCTSELDHCHGTLVLHGSGAVECTEPSCAELVLVRHVLVVECHEMSCRCAD